MRSPRQIIGDEALTELMASGYTVVPLAPTDDMLNAAQSRLCEIENFTYFDDYSQAEMFKAMCAAADTSIK